MRSPPVLLSLALLAAALAAACSSTPRKAEDVPAAIERSRADLGAGRADRAVKTLKGAQEVPGLSTEVRDDLDTLLETAAEQRIHELSREGAVKPRALRKMVDLGLPNQLAVAAGLESARIYLDRGKPYKAYKVLKKLEEKYPRHHGKVEAGSILVEAGMVLADSNWSILGMFSDRSDGIEVLEYVVLTYPGERRCDEAYMKLANMYREDRLFSLARQRYEDLVLWHTESPLRIQAEALIPRMRLDGLKSPEYERRELLKARFELEAWLQAHAGDELEASVRLDHADCVQRLIENDLSVSRFYLRVEQFYGARLHAERALAEARVTGNAKLIGTAESLLNSIPDDSQSRTPDASSFSADESLTRTLIDERAVKAKDEEPLP